MSAGAERLSVFPVVFALVSLATGCGAEAAASPIAEPTREERAQNEQPTPSSQTYDPTRSLAPLVQRVAPSVVSIRAQRRTGWLISRQSESSGSGFVYGREGIIVTNHHVIAGAERLEVTLHDGARVPADIVGSDAATDLAVLRLQGVHNLAPLELGDSNRLQVGDWVVAIGNPMRLDHSASVGIISGRGRGSLNLYSDSYLDFLQTDADIAPGSSGGPLFDLQGSVMGITTAVGEFSRPGFAIPSAQARSVIAQLLQTGSVQRGWLGAGNSDTSSSRIGVVYADTPAAHAGLRPGDVVTALDGQKITDFERLRAIVGTLPPGQSVELDIVRDGVPRTLAVTLGVRPEPNHMKLLRHAPAARVPQDRADSLRLGIRAQHSPNGLEVLAVDATGLAKQLGIDKGDILLELNDQPIRAPQDVSAALEREQTSITVKLMRNDIIHIVTLHRHQAANPGGSPAM